LLGSSDAGVATTPISATDGDTPHDEPPLCFFDDDLPFLVEGFLAFVAFVVAFFPFLVGFAFTPPI
jgi:hypothetical protein